MINLENVKKVYFIGIGGVGMSAAAGIAAQMGYEVLGSDSSALYDPAKSILDNNGINYHIGYSAENIKNAAADLYLVSAGEDLSNPEVAYLSEEGIEMYSFSEFLAEISKDKLRIVVAGTHGKSTTTGFLGKALQLADDSSFMTGAILQHDETNFHVGQGHYFVFEGDEYKSLFDDPTPKFHKYKADILLLTNLEFDHPDIFSSLEEMQDEFRELIHKMPDDGLMVYNADSIALAQLAHESNLGSVSFGFGNNADYLATNIVSGPEGTVFDVAKKDFKNKDREPAIESYKINLFGEMNVYNALGVIATLRTLGFSEEQVQDGLDSFYGLKRRFELISRSPYFIYDDYAHHPTAVLETLRTARIKYPNQKIWAVFEPHTYSRTKATLEELAKAFEPADEVLIAEIYPAREIQSDHSITGQDVVKAIKANKEHVRLVTDRNEAYSVLRSELKPQDIVVIMAVGNFNLLAKDLTS